MYIELTNLYLALFIMVKIFFNCSVSCVRTSIEYSKWIYSHLKAELTYLTNIPYSILVIAVVWHVFNPSNWETGGELCEFKANPIYKVSSRTAKIAQRNPVS